MNEQLKEKISSILSEHINRQIGDGTMGGIRDYFDREEFVNLILAGYNLALDDVKKEIEERRRLPHGWDSEGEPQYWEEIGIDEGYKHILDFIDELTK